MSRACGGVEHVTTHEATEPEQLALLRSTVRASRARPPRPRPEQAAELPVARVAVDVELAHLGPPVRLPGARRPGRAGAAGRAGAGPVRRPARRRVRRASEPPRASTPGALAFLAKVVSAEPVLTPEVLRLARDVADRYAGTLADVLRLAVPPRHARVEAAPSRRQSAGAAAGPARARRVGPLRPRRRAARRDPRRRHRRAPSGRRCPAPAGRTRWPALVTTALAAGRGALVVLPDHRDVARVDAALTELARARPARRADRRARPGRALPALAAGPPRRGRVPSSAPGRRCSRRSATSAWPWCGTTATTCTPSRGRPTRTCATVLALRSSREGAGLLVGGLVPYGGGRRPGAIRAGPGR